MKNEKLDLMLNKVVEFNDPQNAHFKAFLYKNNVGVYYFKIIEILRGDMSFNDIITLNKGDENFLIIAEKPKLMVITKNSWHYRLLKYVLRDNAPTPKDMQNGCPYFWLVMFSMIVVPFILLYKTIKWTLLLIPKAMFWVLKQLVIAWITGIDDEIAYGLEHSYYGNSKLPKTAKIFFNNSDEEFFKMFLSEKYNLSDSSDPKYAEIEEKMRSKWEIWQKNLEEKHNEQSLKYKEKRKIENEKRLKHEKSRAEFKAGWDDRMKPINDSFYSMSVWFKNTFTVERGRRNMLIKRTKQFIGAIVTLLILFVTFFVINYMALGLISHWYVFAILLILAIGVGILYGLYVLIVSIGQVIFDKYNGGKKIWYIEPFIYVIWYPIKYIALLLAYVITKILWLPIRFIFYTCIWSVLSWIGIKISVGVYNFGKLIIGSTGIFGEYFGASYSDYCPGLEWVDFDEEN